MCPLLLALLLAVPAERLAFDAPGFPVHPEGHLPIEVEADRVARSVAELIEELTPDRVLVWRHGSTFPAQAWPAFLDFLEDGGSFLYVGGEPFTRPVVTGPSGFVVQPRTVSLLKELRLNQCHRIPIGRGSVQFSGPALASRDVAPDTIAWALEPRLSDTKDFENEDGAPGSRDAVVRTLALVRRAGDDPRFPCAAGAIAIDRLLGRFAGGRWVFFLLSTPPAPDELDRLLDEASQEPVDLRVTPVFGCFHDGERPSIVATVARPRARDQVEWTLEVDVEGPGGERSALSGIALEVGSYARARIPLPGATRPGLHRVRVRAGGREAVTGFWIMDRELFRSGGPLEFDRYTLRRGGVPEPVVGTTVMSKTVHRKFLFEPDAQVWDDAFRELASIGVNMVRTGVWSAYRKISLDPGAIDEAFLRALEGYYLSARRHGIAVVFTFFAFVPESFGGENPYFDPRAIAGQQAYVSAVARRFADANEMLWDLINEPSFSSPDKLWKCRPNGDRYEREAFRDWLSRRFADDPRGRIWQDVVRARWRLAPDESIGLPDDKDFEDRQTFGDARPYRAKDYVLFAQSAFADWADAMKKAIRDAGSRAPITVGQDEGGLVERPSPLFHDDRVDFTSVHTWWFNDRQLWDVLAARAPAKPLLVSETGIMRRELLSGEALRSPGDSARLLERKIAASFLGGAFGVVEWCHDVNPYMASDNEVAIGLRRPDGSYKPEHAVLRRYAAFVRRNRTRFESPEEPRIALLFPTSDHLGPRSFQLDGTARAIAALGPDDVRVVHEHRVREHLGSPALIVLPACRGISDLAWREVLRRVEEGAVLHASGWFETDDAGLPRERLSVKRRPLRTRELLRDQTIVSFDREIAESWFAADFGDGGDVRVTRLGKGTILHRALPLEWSASADLERAYEDARARAGVRRPEGIPRALRPTTGRLRFSGVDLWISINETAAPLSFRAGGAGAPEVEVPASGAVMVFTARDGSILDRSDR